MKTFQASSSDQSYESFISFLLRNSLANFTSSDSRGSALLSLFKPPDGWMRTQLRNVLSIISQFTREYVRKLFVTRTNHFYLISINWKCMNGKLTLIELNTAFIIFAFICLLNCAGSRKLKCFVLPINKSFPSGTRYIIGHTINCQSGNKWQQSMLNCLLQIETCFFPFIVSEIHTSLHKSKRVEM